MNLPYDAFDFSVWTAVVIRAPDAAWDGGRYVGSVLDAVDEGRARALDLNYQMVRDGQFCAVAADSREAALQAQAALNVSWRALSPAVNPDIPDQADRGGFRRQYRWRVNAAPAGSDRSRFHDRRAYADTPCKAAWTGDTLTLSASTGRDAELAAEAAAIFDIALDRISIVSMDAPADQASYDAAIDAAIAARVLQRPIRVWPVRGRGADAVLTLEQAADLDADGRVRVWTTNPDQPDVLRPSAALAIMRAGQDTPRLRNAGDPDSAQFHMDYADSHVRGTPPPMPMDSAIDAASQRAADLFARESFADEIAQNAGLDPVQWRLQHIQDPAGRALIEHVAAAALWRPHVRGQAAVQDGALPRRGQGLACAHLLDKSADPPQNAWAAWVVDVSVDAASGELNLDKITVGHHLGNLVIADESDARWGRALTQAAQTLLQSGSHDQWAMRERLGRQPPAAPATALSPRTSIIESHRTQDLARPGPLSVSDVLALPAAAAVANAIFDATGLRLREVPFGIDLAGVARVSAPDRPAVSPPYKRWVRLATIAGGVAGLAAAIIPWRPSIPQVTPDLTVYSAAAIERGRLIAAASDCAVCHTAPGGVKNAGGLALDTPFGTIYTTNITPDRETGLGAWSFAAFDRAMRQGVSRDGRHLYPAFPYTSFAKFSDGDMQALYAYVMSEPAVKSTPPATQLAFPYNVRPAMAYWNLLFHENEPYTYDINQSPVWNRGAYLVQGPGHCSACHSPRNVLGAEKTGSTNFLAGGTAHGWDAPALNGTAPTAAPWTTQDLFQYMRSGFSERHGVAAGPMAPVVESLQALPDSDIQAMAVYLSSLRVDTRPQPTEAEPQTAAGLPLAGRNIYEGACAACHDATRGLPLFGVRPSLPLNTNVTADKPDNLIRIVLQGISQPADSALGSMPGFAETLNDAQVAELLSYVRGRYAPSRAPWRNLEDSVRRARADIAHDAHLAGVPR